jgi:Mg2+ and Co2+ transporter CorA
MTKETAERYKKTLAEYGRMVNQLANYKELLNSICDNPHSTRIESDKKSASVSEEYLQDLKDIINNHITDLERELERL